MIFFSFSLQSSLKDGILKDQATVQSDGCTDRCVKLKTSFIQKVTEQKNVSILQVDIFNPIKPGTEVNYCYYFFAIPL